MSLSMPGCPSRLVLLAVQGCPRRERSVLVPGCRAQERECRGSVGSHPISYQMPKPDTDLPQA